ncbi:MAG: FAD-dependent oxidoreductase [Desulfarculus sp.]|nr:FAD-dependent oxidoreductase [Desulfarculus sp.]
MDCSVLVIGAGVAGISAALHLADQGQAVTVVERDDFVGGHAVRLGCKAVDDCQRCNACLLPDRLHRFLNHPGISLLTRSQVLAITRAGRSFQARVQQRPAIIDPERCDDCGLCLEQCPAVEDGALRRPAWAEQRPTLAVDPAACLHFQDGRSSLCQEACPTQAIDFGRPDREMEIAARAVVLAGGFTPAPPDEKDRLGHGRVPNVIAALELEEMLRRSGRATRPSDGREPQRVAFVQCAGSRQRLSRNYCSRICCGYGLRLARGLTQRQGARATVFYMDLQSSGRDPDQFLAEAKRELELIRAMPGDVGPGPADTVWVEYQARSGQPPQRREFDLLVLNQGLAPNPDNPTFTEWLDLLPGQHGFLAEGPGVFVAGTAAGPMDVAESVLHAGRAAQAVMEFLEDKA